MIRTDDLEGYGIEFDAIENGPSTLITWSPGDGFRYQIVFTKLTDEQADRLGAVRGGYLVIDLTHGGRPHVSEGLCHITEVHDKMGIKDLRGLAVAAAVNLAIGNEEYGRECFAELAHHYPGRMKK